MKSSLAQELPLLTNLTVKSQVPEKGANQERTICELAWTFPANTASFYLVFITFHYNNGAESSKKLLGQTDVCKFIASYESPGDIKYVLFYVQPVLLSGFVVPTSLISPVKSELE